MDSVVLPATAPSCAVTCNLQFQTLLLHTAFHHLLTYGNNFPEVNQISQTDSLKSAEEQLELARLR